MGKERLIEAGRASVKSTTEYLKKIQPNEILVFGAAGVGGALSGYSLGIAIFNGNEKHIIGFSISLGMSVGLATINALISLKNSKSAPQHPQSPSVPEN